MREQQIGALGAASLAVCAAALAAPTLVGTPTNASGIDGVVVHAVTYDVTFSTSSFDSTFSTVSASFAAAFALAVDLNQLSVTGLSFGVKGLDCRAIPDGNCLIFTGSSSLLADVLLMPGPPNMWINEQPIVPGINLGCSQGSQCNEAAHWTAVTSSSMPEPATLTLFGLGLVVLGLSRRRLAR